MTAPEGRSGPRVSVVTTAYNDLRFIDAAVDSILRQSYSDLELIVVDDGAGQPSIFARQAAKDARVCIVTNDGNLGTYVSANRAIAQSRGEFIVRLDADDVAEVHRVARLVEALDRDPQLGLVGSFATLIDEGGTARGILKKPQSDIDVRWNSLFHNPFCHSSVAFRRTCYDAVGGYNATMRRSGDYDLWTRMLDICRAQNLSEPLVRYRLNPRGLSANDAPDWRTRTDPLRRQSWARLGVDYEADLIADLVDFIARPPFAELGWRARTRSAVVMILRRFLAVPRPKPSPEQRERMHRLSIMLLQGFLAAPRPFPREEDDAAAQQLKTSILNRVLADRPDGSLPEIQATT